MKGGGNRGETGKELEKDREGVDALRCMTK